MAAVTICSDFGAQENKICHCFHPFPIYLPRSDGEKVGLKLNIQKTKIVASGPIPSWQIEGGKVKPVIDSEGLVTYLPIWDGGEGMYWALLCISSLQMVTAAMKLKDAYSLEGKL